MANDFTQNPFFIDTVQSKTSAYASFPVLVKTIRWASATTAGHTCQIISAKGNTLWQSVASGANYIEAELVERWWYDGFLVSVLQSGQLWITYE